jgi:hypothetical protein
MLTKGYGPFGVGRELKEGVGKDEFVQVDQNLTKSLETQREEKIKLSEHLAHIFSTIAKIGALLAMQPELFALIDICSGLAEMAIKKSIAVEAYDPADDAKMLAIDAAVDLAMVGVSKLAEARKLGAAGKEVVAGDRAAAKALEASAEGDVGKAVAEAKADALAAGKIESGAAHEVEAKVAETKSVGATEGSKAVAATDVDAAAMKGAKPASEVLEAGKQVALPPMMASKGARLTHTPRKQALRELIEEAERANVVIHTDEEAQRLLDWAARSEGVDPSSYHAVTIGDDIFVRVEHAENVRILREELIHVFQQRGGLASNLVVEAEIQARLSMVRFRQRWGITNDEVREMIREIRIMRKTGKY